MTERTLSIIDRQSLQGLLDALKDQGYQTVGPTLRDHAIVYDEISSVQDLPEGWTDQQEAGSYRTKRRKDRALFGYVVGPTSWKRFLYPPRIKLWESDRTDHGFTIQSQPLQPVKYAFLGVRPCELKALAIQDKVFLQGQFVDSVYQARRAQSFIVAVQCGQAAGTCFCTSMNSGPRATQGFDLALTEILDGARHEFALEVGSPRGAELLALLPHRPAEPEEIDRVEQITRRTETQISRHLDTVGLRDLLYQNLEHPRWDETAKRCLSCANCTLVCPTCFCSEVEDVTDLTGNHAERWRVWDSCFTVHFSYIHGGSIRLSPKSRYRQWLTHKLAGWHDQFGTSGCVGCGRCISWCPVGIDLTEEAAMIGKGQKPAHKRSQKRRSKP